MTKNNANVVSNTDSNRMFDLSDTNKMLAAIASSQAAANKIHSQHLDSLNTSNMINNKTRIATETSARQDRNRVGLV